MRCPRPCRAKNATRFLSSVPSTIASEGSPNGVFTRISRVFVNPFIAYSPLPPMMPIAARALDLALFDLLAFFATICILSLAVKAALLQNFVHRGKWILLSSRNFRRQLRQASFAARPSQGALEQPRLEHFNQSVFPMLDVFSLALTARFKMSLKFTHRVRQFLNSLVFRSHCAHHSGLPAVTRHHQ